MRSNAGGVGLAIAAEPSALRRMAMMMFSCASVTGGLAAMSASTPIFVRLADAAYHPETLSQYWGAMLVRVGLRPIHLHDARQVSGKFK